MAKLTEKASNVTENHLHFHINSNSIIFVYSAPRAIVICVICCSCSSCIYNLDTILGPYSEADSVAVVIYVFQRMVEIYFILTLRCAILH